MKTKLPLLFLLPALLMTACGGSGLSEEESNKLKAQISEKSENIENFEFVLDTDGVSYDEETKKNVPSKMHIVYRVNEDDERYMKSTSTQDGVTMESSVYLVNNQEYQQILYVDEYDEEQKKNVPVCYGYEGNEMTFELASFQFMLPEVYMGMFVDPANLAETGASTGEGDEDFNISTKYTSSGEGNLTVEINAKAKKDISKDEEEQSVSANYKVEYKNYYFSSASVTAKSNKGNTSKVKASLEIKSKFAIELPKGWEDIINAESEPGLLDGGEFDF